MSEEKKFEGANAAPSVVSESELADVSGGGVGGCFFTTDGEKKIEGGDTWLKCKSNCTGYVKCDCHGKGHCVDQWHKLQSDNCLSPVGFSNHSKKVPSNNYNT